MSTIDKSISQVIKALIELEAKGCHSVSFEYGNGLCHVKIFKDVAETQKVVFEKSIDTAKEYAELEELTEHINRIKFCIVKTIFQCYRRELIVGVRVGEWEKSKPVFEVGSNATHEALINGSYYVNDPDNSLQYFVICNQLNETY